MRGEGKKEISEGRRVRGERRGEGWRRWEREGNGLRKEACVGKEGESMVGWKLSRKDKEKAVPIWIKLLRFCPELRVVVEMVDGDGDHCPLRNSHSIDLRGFLSLTRGPEMNT